MINQLTPVDSFQSKFRVTRKNRMLREILYFKKANFRENVVLNLTRETRNDATQSTNDSTLRNSMRLHNTYQNQSKWHNAINQWLLLRNMTSSYRRQGLRNRRGRRSCGLRQWNRMYVLMWCPGTHPVSWGICIPLLRCYWCYHHPGHSRLVSVPVLAAVATSQKISSRH